MSREEAPRVVFDVLCRATQKCVFDLVPARVV